MARLIQQASKIIVADSIGFSQAVQQDGTLLAASAQIGTAVQDVGRTMFQVRINETIIDAMVACVHPAPFEHTYNDAVVFVSVFPARDAVITSEYLPDDFKFGPLLFTVRITTAAMLDGVFGFIVENTLLKG